MPFAITKSCCTDAACVSVCPVGCIHPAPGEPGFGSSEILHIDPETCIDCGACADACPVDAIYPIDRLGRADRIYAEINAAYYAPERELSPEAPLDVGPAEPADVPPVAAKLTAGDDDPSRRVDSGLRDEGSSRHESPAQSHGYPLLGHIPAGCRIAVIGTGPAGMYTLRELLARTDAHITVIDELPTPGGLVRSGVAPDHPQTKNVQRGFDVAMRHPRVSFLGGVTIGRDVTLEEVRHHFDAVFLATGAQRPRRLGAPGEDLPAVHSARDLTAWAGGVPGWDDDPFAGNTGATGAERSRRAVIVGTGNVALDIVRLLSLPTPDLERTDLAGRALDVLRRRPVRDIVVLGRRTARDAAYTEAEFRALPYVPGLEVRALEADEPFDSLDWNLPTHGTRVTFVFGTSIERFESPAGAGVVAHLARAADDDVVPLDADLVITSLGYDVEPMDGLPFDADRGTVEHDGGRVRSLPGVYVVGWIKRGARGGIGTNRGCAQESVDAYVRDAATLPRSASAPGAFVTLLRTRGVHPTDRRGAVAIDRAELRAGARVGRPRVKLTTLEELRASAQTRRRPRRAS